MKLTTADDNASFIQKMRLILTMHEYMRCRRRYPVIFTPDKFTPDIVTPDIITTGIDISTRTFLHWTYFIHHALESQNSVPWNSWYIRPTQCTICFWFETPILTQRLVFIPDMSLAKVLLLYEA